MNLFTISLRNLQRRPFRALMFSLVFVAGLATVVGLHYVSSDIGRSMEEKLSRFGANVVILPQENSHTVSYGGVQLGSLSYVVNYLDEADTVAAVRSIEFDENISAVAPKLIETGHYGNQDILIAGVNWEQELFLNPAWDISYADTETAVYTAAGSGLGLNKGDTVSVAGTMLTINHVLTATGGDTDKLVFTSLNNLQTVTGKPDKVNFVEVAALCSGCPIEDIVSQISANTDAQVKALQSVVQQRMYTINFVETLVWCIIAIILIASVLMMGLFMLSSVNERKKEIGIMRAIGYSKLSIFAAICTEAAVLLLFSGTVGYVLGYFASIKVLAVMDIALVHSGLPIGDMFLTIAAAVAMAVAAAAIPAVKAARLNPSEALNRL